MPDREPAPAGARRILAALFLPLLGATVLSALLSAPAGIFLGVVGIISWLLGLRMYGLRGLGLRGGRPLYASIGFATLGWIAVFLARLLVTIVDIGAIPLPEFARILVYLFLFEALSVQVWLFGLLFRALADWRGPLTAAVVAGLSFGAVGFLFFEESFLGSSSSLFYFMLWGIFYGLIRLRTGSIVGMVLIQTMQTLTVWHVLLPLPVPAAGELQNFYLAAGLFYLIFIWRLWPKEEADYRI